LAKENDIKLKQKMKPHVQHGWGARIDKLIGLLAKVVGLTRIGKETICAERKKTRLQEPIKKKQHAGKKGRDVCAITLWH